MAYAIMLTPAAERRLKKMPDAIKAEIAVAINGLSVNPRPPGTIKMTGRNAYRIRCGSLYRLIYTIQDKKLIVEVIQIGHRREVYR